MQLKPRTEIVGTPYYYQSSAVDIAERFGGAVSRKTGKLYVDTADGLTEVHMNDWVLRVEGETLVMRQDDVLRRYYPVDPTEAYDVLGYQNWPAAVV